MRRALLGMILIAGCGHAEDFGSSDRPEPSTTVGAECANDGDCVQYCSRDQVFPDGFCTIRNCRDNRDCPDGTVCITEDHGVCVFPCEDNLDCAEFLARSSYFCLWSSGFNNGDATNIRYKVCRGED